ncbi:hypothetical protein AMTRI_Chr10g231620 [Amborella trichopoda]
MSKYGLLFGRHSPTPHVKISLLPETILLPFPCHQTPAARISLSGSRSVSGNLPSLSLSARLTHPLSACPCLSLISWPTLSSRPLFLLIPLFVLASLSTRPSLLASISFYLLLSVFSPLLSLLVSHSLSLLPPSFSARLSLLTPLCSHLSLSLSLHFLSGSLFLAFCWCIRAVKIPIDN